LIAALLFYRNKMATEVKLFGKWTYDDVKTKEEISLCVRPLPLVSGFESHFI
jgi:hypothetical protein